ncbi:serine/threonine protein kinase [Undibacterium sp. GrIS 1.2]|uniref:serine/threonine protein kinase n=1 Tax=Undibacterium sp. GrIS 1.2 TaxID=3143933 RepID=UPI0033958995
MSIEKIRANAKSEALQSVVQNCLAVGTRLNDFEITGILGEGGFGIVYLAFDHSLQRTVAIKEYIPGALASRAADSSVVVRVERHKKTFDAGLKSFINEARLLAQFDHPFLVKVYRFWEENKTAYMVMRHYDGFTLKEIVNQRPELVTEAWLKFIFKQILEALDTLYKAKILHRDVSPDNIIVQKNGDAVLLDFGSARQIIGDMTQGLTVILKPGYAPVEQYSDEDDLQQGPWTDIYALAAVMYFTILKTPPPISVARIVKDTLNHLQNQDRPGFSTKFLMAVDKGLAIQPQDRPQTVDEFRRLLGISAFGSARTSRLSKSGANVDLTSETNDQIAKVASIKNVAYKNAVASATASVDDVPGIGESRLITIIKKNKSKILAGTLGLCFFLDISIYFSVQHRAVKPLLNSIAKPLPLTAPTAPQPAAVASDIKFSSAIPQDSVTDKLPEINQEKLAWDKLSADANLSKQAVSTFLQQFPNGKYAELAQARINEFNQSETLAKTTAPLVQDKALSKFNVKLTIKPWGTVFVDGVQNGASPPLKNLKLAKGIHKIRVTNPGFPDFVTEVDTSKNNSATSVTIEHEFTAK